MNKKLFTILCILAFLIASAGFVYASDDTPGIDVKIVWEDASSSARPDQVTVNLIHDGNVVDTVKLSSSNSWSATFKNQDIDGSYTIKVNDIANYNVKNSGNAENGFVITAKSTDGVLSASAENTTEKTNDVVETPLEENESGDTSNEPATGATDDTNSSDESTTGETNTTDNSTENSTDTETTDETTDESVDTTVESKTTTKYTTTTIVKEKAPKKPVHKDNTTTTLRNTGLPIALILLAIAAVFIPIMRKK